MPHITTDDGVKLAYEEAGSGTPVVFVHEFAGDMASWEPQLRTFGMRYRAIAYNARGYPPSDVPPAPGSYSQDRARQDILAVLDGLGVEKAHIVGLSMGGFATLHFGIHHSDRALSITVAGCGYGAEPDKREQFKMEANATADLIQNEGMEARSPTPIPSARPVCSFRTRTRADGRSSGTSWQHTPRSAPPIPCAVYRRSVPRSST